MATTLADIRRFDVVQSRSEYGRDVYRLFCAGNPPCAF
jgi:hypothetical protein